MAYVGDELPKPFSNLTENRMFLWLSDFGIVRFWSRYIGRNSNL